MKSFRFSFTFAVFLFTGCSVEQPSTIEAIGKGEVREVLSATEVEALEAEKNAASSRSPQRSWKKASKAYREASKAARIAGQLQKAISYGKKALEMGEKARDLRLQVIAISHLAFAYRAVGDHAKAREWIEKGIEITKQIPHGGFREAMEGKLYRRLGFIVLRQGKTQEAIDYISYSLQVQESRLDFLKSRRRLRNPQLIPNTQRQMVVTLHRLGTAHQKIGNIEEAIKAYERGIGLIKELGSETHVDAILYGGLGQLYLKQRDFTRALEYLQKALEMGEKLHQPSAISRAGSQIGDLLRQTRRPSEAIPYYEKAIESIESTRSLLESEEYRTSFFEDKRRIYAGMILAHLHAGNPEDSFNYNERARSRAFLDILGSRVQLARGGTLFEEERALLAKISTLRAKLTDEDAPRKGQLRLQLETAQKAYNDFLVKVRREDREQASLMNVEPLTLKQVQELLDPGVSILEYFVVRKAVLLWVVEKDQVQQVKIPVGKRELVSKVTSLRDTIFQVGEREKFRAHSEELYRLLIESALPHIHGKELLIIPHDVLHYLPYQALLSPQGRYLIEHYPIYYLSSASLMQFTKEKRRASREKALVLGNPSLGDQAYNLRFSEREAREVARIYPKSAIYLRSEATKSRVISLSPKYDILHFAVHGELKEEDPLNSGLLFAQEAGAVGVLNVREIFSLKLKADTVVLSACETALGKITNGDEIIGLTRAFIYAGTPSVIATLWKVNDRASYELMRGFYTRLKTAKKSEALRQAQLKIMQKFPEPYFWAAYALTGEP